MTFRERAQLLFDAFRRHPRHSIRQRSSDTHIPTSSVHRHDGSQKKRVDAVGHDFFETAVGFKWLKKLLLAVIFIFGLHAHVGSAIIFRFFETLQLSRYIGSAPSTIRKMKAITRDSLAEYDDEQWTELDKKAADTEVHVGVDDTDIGNERCLLMMELTSGVILTEEKAPNRQFKTWWSCIKNTLKKFKTVLAISSDGANALTKIGKKTKTAQVMDFFHLQHDIIQLFRAKLSIKINSLSKQIQKLPHDDALTEEERIHKNDLRTRLSVTYQAKKAYKKALFTLSTNTHPFNGSTIVPSETLHKQLADQCAILDDIVKNCDINDKYKLLNRAKKRIAPLAKLNDLWLQWVDRSLECKITHSDTQQWAKHTLLPYYYWQQQLKKTRKRTLRSYYSEQLSQTKKALNNDLLTASLLSEGWVEWAKAMSQKYHRTTSAIEGRNARLAEHYFNLRGLNSDHLKTLTIIHNFWIKRDDHTTAIERLFKVKPPDLFKWLTEHIDYMPLPRERQATVSAA